MWTKFTLKWNNEKKLTKIINWNFEKKKNSKEKVLACKRQRSSIFYKQYKRATTSIQLFMFLYMYLHTYILCVSRLYICSYLQSCQTFGRHQQQLQSHEIYFSFTRLCDTFRFLMLLFVLLCGFHLKATHFVLVTLDLVLLQRFLLYWLYTSFFTIYLHLHL